MDAVSGEADRIHERGMARMNGSANGGSSPPASSSDDQQQQQIDALIDAVGRLQQAVVHIADALGGGDAGAPPPPDMGPPPVPPPPMMDMGPPPGGPPPGAPPPPAPGFNQSSPPGISGPI